MRKFALRYVLIFSYFLLLHPRHASAEVTYCGTTNNVWTPVPCTRSVGSFEQIMDSYVSTETLMILFNSNISTLTDLGSSVQVTSVNYAGAQAYYNGSNWAWDATAYDATGDISKLGTFTASWIIDKSSPGFTTNFLGISPPQCNYPIYCIFPNFAGVGQFVGGENVFQIDIFDNVPSYLNSNSDGGTGSYYQCTEYAARYLNSRFGTNYTDRKNISDSNSQGFRGFDFHPNYGGNPPKPTVDKGTGEVSFTQVTSPKSGDIAIFTTVGHTAVVKSVSGSNVTLIEQNWIANGKYTVNRTVTIPASDIYFYRISAAYIKDSGAFYSSIQDAYDSTTTDGQTVILQGLVFTESPNLANDISISILGGFDNNFSSKTGWSTINGQLTIGRGTVILGDICFE